MTSPEEQICAFKTLGTKESMQKVHGAGRTEVHMILVNLRTTGICCNFRQVETMATGTDVMYNDTNTLCNYNIPIFDVMQMFL